VLAKLTLRLAPVEQPRPGVPKGARYGALEAGEDSRADPAVGAGAEDGVGLGRAPAGGEERAWMLESTVVWARRGDGRQRLGRSRSERADCGPPRQLGRADASRVGALEKEQEEWRNGRT
jgi:hypothetical protein